MCSDALLDAVSKHVCAWSCTWAALTCKMAVGMDPLLWYTASLPAEQVRSTISVYVVDAQQDRFCSSRCHPFAVS